MAEVGFLSTQPEQVPPHLAPLSATEKPTASAVWATMKQQGRVTFSKPNTPKECPINPLPCIPSLFPVGESAARTPPWQLSLEGTGWGVEQCLRPADGPSLNDGRGRNGQQTLESEKNDTKWKQDTGRKKTQSHRAPQTASALPTRPDGNRCESYQRAGWLEELPLLAPGHHARGSLT